jgi:rod shape determining protein RodA
MSPLVQWSSLRRLDAGLLAAVLALLAAGILFVFSAGYRGEGFPISELYLRQIGWAAVGLVCLLGVAAVNYHAWVGLAWWGYALSLLLLALTLWPGIGVAMYGARRWLDFGVVKVQPAEFVKIAVIVALARLLGQPGRNLNQTRYGVLAVALIAVPMLLIMRQPDLGTALVLPPVALAMMYVAGVPGRFLKRLVLAGFLAVALVLGAVALPPRLGATPEEQDRIVRLVGLSPYQRDRLLVFLDSERDPLNAGWNKAQSQIAVGSGGFWGKGYLAGTQNLLGFLPRTVAPTDFIFSVIAEEMGFVGSLGLLILFAIVLVSGARIALAAGDAAGRLLALGLVTLWFCHVFVNIAMTMGLMPITGIPLPLISYGGSFMVGTMAALGLLQSVYSRSRRG